MAEAFLLNCWYVAGWADEIEHQPLVRTICNEPILMFKDPAGQPVALSDRCPHRKAPLSSGSVQDGEIACGYHGIRFNSQGRCVHVPGGLSFGQNFAVRAFPAQQAHGFIFVWMGSPELADPSSIPDFFENDAGGWVAVRDTLPVACNYQLLTDNLLDLTHVVFVHKTTLGGSQVTDAPLEVTVDGDIVRAERFMKNVDTAPIFRAACGLDGKIDRWQIFEWRAPSYIKLTLGARAVGDALPYGTPVHRVLNALTPETDTTTHYFWSTARNWALQDEKVDTLYFNMISEAFAEDKVIAEQQQQYIMSDTSKSPLIAFAFDKAGQSARRILRAKIEAEQTEAPAGGP